MNKHKIEILITMHDTLKQNNIKTKRKKVKREYKNG